MDPINETGRLKGVIDKLRQELEEIKAEQSAMELENAATVGRLLKELEAERERVKALEDSYGGPTQ